VLASECVKRKKTSVKKKKDVRCKTTKETFNFFLTSVGKKRLCLSSLVMEKLTTHYYYYYHYKKKQQQQQQITSHENNFTPQSFCP